MKTEIHPKYFQATVTCASCGQNFQAGSTTESIRVDICSNCHPFFTGQKRLVDTEGRVERFERRSAQRVAKSKPKKAKAQPVFSSVKTSAPAKQAEKPVETNRPKSLREMLQEAADNS